MVVKFWIVTLFCGALSAQSTEPVKLAVDATDVTRRLLHARMTFPVKAGDFRVLTNTRTRP